MKISLFISKIEINIMQLSNSSSIILDIVPPTIIEPNFENIQTKNIHCCCRLYFIDLIIFIISYSIFIALPLIEIIIGFVYLNECSMNYYIPIYLIVAGFISSIILILVILGVKPFYEIGLFLFIFCFSS